MPLLNQLTLPVVFASSLFLIQATLAQEAATDPVAATVGDTKIYASQIDRLYKQKFADRKFDPKLAVELRARVLKQLVDQQIVVEYLNSLDQAATDDEVNLEIDRISERLKAIDKTLLQFLEENQQTMHGLRFNLHWQLSWTGYLDQHLNDANLEKFFNSDRRRFNGTQLHVAHILLKLEKDATEDDVQKVTDRLAKIRKQVVAGEITWEQAVQQNSSAPTKDRGGDIGWIKRSGPMPRAFTDASFSLEAEQISEPVRTRFGVHLIKCLEVRPGTASWYDVRPQLRDAAIQFLFERILEKHSDEVDVQFTGARPYLDRKTGELVK